MYGMHARLYLCMHACKYACMYACLVLGGRDGRMTGLLLGMLRNLEVSCHNGESNWDNEMQTGSKKGRCYTGCQLVDDYQIWVHTRFT